MKKTRKLSALLAAVLLTAALSALPAQAATWEKGEAAAPKTSAAQKEGEKVTVAEEFSAEVLRLVNAERAALKLKPFAADEKLAKVAAVRAKESATKFAHERPDGRAVSTAYSDEGLSYLKAGENLGAGHKTADALVKDWMGSKAHKANILSEKFTLAEVGYHTNSAGKIYIALMFMTPSES